MTANLPSAPSGEARQPRRTNGPLNSIKFFVFCHGLLQLSQLLVSGYLKSSISTIERRYGFSSQKSGLLASFNEVGNTVLIVFVSYFGSRVHRPRFIGAGAMIASLAAMLMALPHFISGLYQYNHSVNRTSENSSGLCHVERNAGMKPSQQNCSQQESSPHQEVLPIMLFGQLLLGIGGVPIQPFGISYIDDYASKRNSPLYLGILFAVTVIGPACGFMLGSLLLRFYVDFDKLSQDEIVLERQDPRWVGAWWLGFLLAASLLFLSSLPYLFFPRKMPIEEATEDIRQAGAESLVEKNQNSREPQRDLSLTQFLKGFPSIVVRTLRNPIYLLVVFAQVNLSAMVAGIFTFMAKFIEQQFTKTQSLSNMMIGGLNIPVAVLGIVSGGIIMRRFSLSVKSSALMCTGAVLAAFLFSFPLLFLGCPTQNISGVFTLRNEGISPCMLKCSCEDEAFNPVCGSDGVEFRSPCHAGCQTKNVFRDKVLNYTDCSCISSGLASPGTCGSGCSHFFVPFLILSALTGFVASFSHTPSFLMILRTVKPEDKSFSLGIQFMMFRVLAFMPGPVLFGSVIDTTCILWGKNCDRKTSCRYYNLNHFRQRFLGLQVFFIFGAFVCFLLAFVVLRNANAKQKELQARSEGLTGNGNKPSDMLLKNPGETVKL